MTVVVRVDPKIVIVAVQPHLNGTEGLAHVIRDVETQAEPVHAVLVLRVGTDLRKVPGGLIESRIDLLPGLAAVGAAENAARRLERIASAARATGRRTVAVAP